MFEPTRRRRLSPLPLAGILAALVLGAVALQMLRSLPPVVATTTVAPATVLGEARSVTLPVGGGSTVAVTGLGVVASGGSQAARPIASVTKVMTAYVILKEHPLQPNESGASISITAADQSRYIQMLNQDQSVLPVSSGQTYTQLQLLQGLLVPSANNFGEILANWDAGSVAAFVAKMNAEARALGMTNTIYADTSGFSAGSTSTPADQLVLARAAMANPVFAQIVATAQVRLPGIGLTTTTNDLLGLDGIIGIKTGFTEDAGGNLAFAARRLAGGQEIEVVGMVFGLADKPAAFSATRAIVNSLAQGVQTVQVMTRGQAVATLETAWGGKVDVVAAEDVTMLLWPGMTLQTLVEFDPLKASTAAGEPVGWLSLRLGDQERRVPLTLATKLEGASVFWRLTRF